MIFLQLNAEHVKSVVFLKSMFSDVVFVAETHIHCGASDAAKHYHTAGFFR